MDARTADISEQSVFAGLPSSLHIYADQYARLSGADGNGLQNPQEKIHRMIEKQNHIFS